jgi:hypothetical protein
VYPVRNRDYREWREKHQRGGDFLIFSDIATHELAQPIILEYPDHQPYPRQPTPYTPERRDILAPLQHAWYLTVDAVREEVHDFSRTISNLFRK